MTELPLPVLGTARVWIIPPTALNASGQARKTTETIAAYVFPWSWGWKEARQLIPIASRERPDGMGSADFQLLRQTRQEIGRSSFQLLDDGLVEGQWICITTGTPLLNDANGKPTDQIDSTKITFIGWIATIEAEQLAGTSEAVGSVTALGLGHLLDKRQIYGWRQPPAGNGYVQTINSPPQANIAGIENQVIGNAIQGQDGNGHQVYLFARMPSECLPATFAAGDTKVWTRWRLLQHLQYLCQPSLGAPLTVKTADSSEAFDPSDTAKIAGYLNDTTFPEVFELAGLTWRGALDMLIPDTRCVGWYLTVDAAGWYINVYTFAETGSTFGVPINAGVAVNLPDESATAVVLKRSAEDLPDEIVYESAHPILIGVTIGGPDKNLDRMWTDQQEADYCTAASGAPGYSGLTPVQQKERNANVRNGPGFHDVFTKYGLSHFGDSTGRDLVRYDPPITTKAGGSPKALVPQLIWNGSTLTVDNANSRTPYLPTARFMRTIPWQQGLWADGTDHRDATSKANPAYLLPGLFRYDTASATNGGYTWVDLLARNGRPGALSVQLDIDDRSPALRVIANPPEMLAYKHWAVAAHPSPSLSDVDPETNGAALDYSKLVATVGIESDQRIQIIIPRPSTQAGTPQAPGGNNVRRSLIIRDDKLHCWLMLKNSVLAIKNDGTADLVTGTNVNDASTGLGAGFLVRNDWPLAQRRANQLAGFVFRKRTAVTIERSRSDDFPTWARIGKMITKIVEVAADTTLGEPISEVSNSINTVVVEVARSYGPRPRMRVTTGLPSMLSVGASGGASPAATGGGRVSATGGGTVAQQAAALSVRVNQLERQTDRMVVVPPKGGSSDNALYELVIDRGQTLSDGSTLGIKWANPAPTTVPSLYDPTVTSSFIDGIGRATLWKDNVSQGLVLVAHYTGNGSPLTLALVQGMTVQTSPATITLPLASDPTQTVTLYIPHPP